jgi:hypothetical protein
LAPQLVLPQDLEIQDLEIQDREIQGLEIRDPEIPLALAASRLRININLLFWLTIRRQYA